MSFKIAFIFSCLVGFCLPVFANGAVEAVGANGSVFGVSPGLCLYSGAGTLCSQAVLVPDLDFVSVRRISNGTIRAKTIAKLFGATLATASADLKIVPLDDGKSFELIDLATSKSAGAGTCSEIECTFTAEVMNGNLRLTETWLATENGFEVRDASQEFNGLPALYSSVFNRKR